MPVFTDRCHIVESVVCGHLVKAGWKARRYAKAQHPSGLYVAKTYANAEEQIGVWSRNKPDGAVLLIPITEGPTLIAERIARYVARATS